MNAQLRVITGALGRPARLRADRIRRDTLTRLASALAEDHDSDLTNALDRLVDAVKHDAPDVEIDALVADVEDLADMGRADMALTDGDVQQLATEAAHAANISSADVVTLPVQQDRRWSA